jgi:hypothetical protein
MTATSGDILPVWAWALIIVLVALLLATVGDVAARLLAARRSRPGPRPYDWERDDGLLDVWARDDEGEVLTVIPASWRYR